MSGVRASPKAGSRHPFLWNRPTDCLNGNCGFFFEAVGLKNPCTKTLACDQLSQPAVDASFRCIGVCLAGKPCRLSQNHESRLPFADVENLGTCKQMVWCLPDAAGCDWTWSGRPAIGQRPSSHSLMRQAGTGPPTHKCAGAEMLWRGACKPANDF